MSHPSINFKLKDTGKKEENQKLVDLCESRRKKHKFVYCKLVLDIINPTNLQILLNLLIGQRVTGMDIL